MKVTWYKVIAKEDYALRRDFWTGHEYYSGDVRNLGRFTTKDKALDRIRRWAENEKGFSFDENHYKELIPVFNSFNEIESEELDVVGLFYDHKHEAVTNTDDWDYATYAFIKLETYFIDEDINEKIESS